MVENFAAGGAAINQICARLRSRPQGLRPGARSSDRRHHRRGGAGRARLRRHHGLRHGGDRRRRRPSLHRRDGHRQHDDRGGDLRRAVRRRAGATGSAPAPASTARACGASATAVAAALALPRGHLDDPLEVLRRLGGREIAAMAGAILAARMEQRAGDRRRLCGDRGGGGSARARPAGPRPLPVRPCLGRAGPSCRRWRRWARRRFSPSACGSARAPGAALAAGIVKAAAGLPCRHGDLRAGRCQLEDRTRQLQRPGWTCRSVRRRRAGELERMPVASSLPEYVLPLA